MGICKHCGKDISLKEGEIDCPSCGMPPYHCWNCSTNINGETKECLDCGFFICPECGSCGRDCQLIEYIEIIKKNTPRIAIEKILEIIKGKIRLNCHKGIPISYGKSELRNMAVKLSGYHTRNEADKNAYEERLEKVINFPIGKIWTISQERELGFNGKELRTISNMGVCMGIIKKERIRELNEKTNTFREYDRYERIKEGMPCEYSNWKKLIVWSCPKCGKQFDDKYFKCCSYTKNTKGKKKGDYFELKERLSSVHFCQKPRVDFKRREEDNGESSRLI